MSLLTHDLGQSPAEEVIFFPASFAQQRLWFIDQLTPGKATYNIPSALQIRGKLEVEVLKRTLEEIARRHETLRTRFVAVSGEPQQVIEDLVVVQLPLLDLAYVVGEREREAEAVRLAWEEAQQPFDLQQAPLFRGKVLRLGPLNYVFLFTIHHIISDAWSMGVLFEEVSVIYDAFSAGQPSPLPELPIQYADYSVWQRKCLEEGLLEPQVAYWKEQLAGSSVLKLPTDRPRPATQSQNGATRDFVIDVGLTQRLKKLAEEQGATLFMVLVAAFQTLLYRYSGQPDIAVGIPIAGRSSSTMEKLIGFFINTLVLRVDLSGALSFTELLQRTKEVTLEAHAHQDVPFEKLVEVLSLERNPGSTPLFQVMIVLQNTPQSDLRLGAARLHPFSTVDNGTAKFDLLLHIAEDESGMLTSSLQYNTDLFEAESVIRMIDHYQILLSGIANNPGQSIALLPLLTANEGKQVIEEWNRKIDRNSLPQADADTPEQEYVGPRNPAEETLCRLWQEVLRRERVGIHDNFFKIGGHSLLAVQLISRIRSAFALEMPLSVLFAAPTAARIAEHIASVNGQERLQSSSILVAIQPHGSSAPFFCVHPVGGQVVCYMDLAKQLGSEQPFYGLQSPPASESVEIPISIEEMARLYCQEILRVQSEGPHLLGGWSMGGSIAFEMARQLKLSGKSVALLALFDTHPPAKVGVSADGDKEHKISMLVRFAADLSQSLGKDWTGLAEGFLRSEPQQQWALLLETLVNDGLLPQDGVDAAFKELLNVFTRNSVARDNYSPSSQEQSTILFQAAENNAPQGYDPGEWAALTGGSLEVHEIPGDHYSLLRAPGVSLIADVLRRRIAQVSEGFIFSPGSHREYVTSAGGEPQQLLAASADTRL